MGQLNGKKKVLGAEQVKQWKEQEEQNRRESIRVTLERCGLKAEGKVSK